MLVKALMRGALWRSGLCAVKFPSRLVHATGPRLAQNNDEDDDLDLDANLLEERSDEGSDKLNPRGGHRVYVVEPDVRALRITTPAMLRIEESCALVRSLPGWTVVDSVTHSQMRCDDQLFFSPTNALAVTAKIRANPTISALFVSVSQLTPIQLRGLQVLVRVPVYDRFTMVLQIFKLRAQTREARLQVAVAELYYFRNVKRQDTLGDTPELLASQSRDLRTNKRLYEERHTKLMNALHKIDTQQELLREGRRKGGWPLVAVVGYTNAGKTTLIKALTADQDIEPRDALFATLDATVHVGRLKNRMRVLYTDTVGFFFRLPHRLLPSFRVTMREAENADVVLHVWDASHTNFKNQRLKGIKELTRTNSTVPVIEVANKADLAKGKTVTTLCHKAGAVLVSATTGQGLDVLSERLAAELIRATDSLTKTFRIPMAGQHLDWLHAQAAVESSRTCEKSSEFLIVHVIISRPNYARFLNLFGKPRITSKTEPKSEPSSGADVDNS